MHIKGRAEAEALSFAFPRFSHGGANLGAQNKIYSVPANKLTTWLFFFARQHPTMSSDQEPSSSSSSALFSHTCQPKQWVGRRRGRRRRTRRRPKRIRLCMLLPTYLKAFTARLPTSLFQPLKRRRQSTTHSAKNESRSAIIIIILFSLFSNIQ